MSRAAAAKKTADADFPVPDDRRALALAIENKRKADDAVTAQEEAITRASSLADEADAELEKLRRKVPDAEDADVKRAASSIKAEVKIVSPWAGDKARGSVRAAEDRCTLLRQALDRLQTDLAVLQDDAAEAANVVAVEIRLVMLPALEKMFQETRAAKAKVAIGSRLLAELATVDERGVRFHSAVRDMAAAQRRDVAMGDLRRRVQGLTFNTDDAFRDAAAALAQWRDAIAALKSDASAPLPAP